MKAIKNSNQGNHNPRRPKQNVYVPRPLVASLCEQGCVANYNILEYVSYNTLYRLNSFCPHD